MEIAIQSSDELEQLRARLRKTSTCPNYATQYKGAPFWS